MARLMASQTGNCIISLILADHLISGGGGLVYFLTTSYFFSLFARQVIFFFKNKLKQVFLENNPLKSRSFLFYNLHLIHCLPKVGLHA